MLGSIIIYWVLIDNDTEHESGTAKWLHHGLLPTMQNTDCRKIIISTNKHIPQYFERSMRGSFVLPSAMFKRAQIGLHLHTLGVGNVKFISPDSPDDFPTTPESHNMGTEYARIQTCLTMGFILLPNTHIYMQIDNVQIIFDISALLEVAIRHRR